MVSGSPVLALGTVQWGMPYGISNLSGQPSDSDVRDIIAVAESAGIVLLDTARAYGSSEEVIGRIVGRSPSWKIFTKLAIPDSLAADNCDLKRAAEVSLAASRQALTREYLDAVLLHRPNQYGTAAWDTLRRARLSGTIGMVGYSALSPEDAWDAVTRPDVEIVEVPASLIDQRLFRSGWFRAARDRKLFIVVRSIFLQGAAMLAADNLPPHLAPLAPLIRQIDAWAKSNQATRLDSLFAAVRGLPADAVLVGCETSTQLITNVAAWERAAHLAERIDALTVSLPELSETVLNPAKWPALDQTRK